MSIPQKGRGIAAVLTLLAALVLPGFASSQVQAADCVSQPTQEPFEVTPAGLEYTITYQGDVALCAGVSVPFTLTATTLAGDEQLATAASFIAPGRSTAILRVVLACNTAYRLTLSSSTVAGFGSVSTGTVECEESPPPPPTNCVRGTDAVAVTAGGTAGVPVGSVRYELVEGACPGLVILDLRYRLNSPASSPYKPVQTLVATSTVRYDLPVTLPELTTANVASCFQGDYVVLLPTAQPYPELDRARYTKDGTLLTGLRVYPKNKKCGGNVVS